MMKQNTTFFCGILLLLLTATAHATASPRQVGGKISDSVTCKPIKNVIITLCNDTLQRLSDREGRYTLNAQDGDTLVFYRPGYAQQKIKITASNHDIRLQPVPITTVKDMLLLKILDDTLPRPLPRSPSKEIIRIRGTRNTGH